MSGCDRQGGSVRHDALRSLAMWRYRSRVVIRPRPRKFLRWFAQRAARLLVLLAVVCALGRGARQVLVCNFTNEILSACCCPAEKDKTETPEVRRTCCCRTMLVTALPEAAPPDADKVSPVRDASAVVALRTALVSVPTRDVRLRLPPRETGPPPQRLPNRLARLQVLHL